MTKRQIVSFGILALCILIMLPLVVTAQGQPDGGGRGGNSELSKLSVKGGKANPLQERGAPTPIK